jgi:hypothetical protein
MVEDFGLDHVVAEISEVEIGHEDQMAVVMNHFGTDFEVAGILWLRMVGFEIEMVVTVAHCVEAGRLLRRGLLQRKKNHSDG